MQPGATTVEQIASAVKAHLEAPEWERVAASQESSGQERYDAAKKRIDDAAKAKKSRPAAEITQGTGKTPAKEYPAHDDTLPAPRTGDVEVVEAPLRRISIEY